MLEALIGRTWLFWNAELYIRASSRWERRPLAKARHDLEISRGVIPIPCQSHNDYWRDKPLFDAIHWGCIGAEADVWLFDEDLYIGHTLATLSLDRTLKKMYIDPLASLLGKQDPAGDKLACAGHGLFETSPSQTFVLLIDIKNSGPGTMDFVQRQLQSLRNMGCLSHWEGGKFNSREITIVLTGQVAFDHVMNNGTYRDIFFDAPLHSLWEKPRSPISKSDSLHEKDGEIDYGTAMSLQGEGAGFDRLDGVLLDSFNASTSYYASTSFFSSVGYVWRGHISPRQMDIIRGQIRGAKRRGLKVRYWDTPSWPISLRNHVWHVLVKEGVDVLNVDDLAGAALDDWTIPVHNGWLS